MTFHTADLMKAVRANLSEARMWNGEWPCPIAVDIVKGSIVALEEVLKIVREREKRHGMAAD